MKKAQDIEGIYDVFEHDRALTPEDVDDFYVDIYKEDVDNFVTDLRFNKDEKKIFLIAGQSGNGKSSVLNTLTTKYKKIEEKYEFHFISGKRIFLYDDIDIIDVLLMIGNVLSRTSTKLSNAYKKKLQDLEDVKTGVLQGSEQNINSQNNTLEANAKISFGANFFSFLKGENPPIHGDGKQSRDFTYVENIVEANIGQSIIARSIFTGLQKAIEDMNRLIKI